MSESKKYTLPRVLEIVRGHAVALFAAAEGLDDGKDPDILALVGERALKASVDLWAIENIVGTNRGKIAEWNDSTRIYRSLFTLPTLALAGEVPAPIRTPHCPLTNRGHGADSRRSGLPRTSWSGWRPKTLASRWSARVEAR